MPVIKQFLINCHFTAPYAQSNFGWNLGSSAPQAAPPASLPYPSQAAPHAWVPSYPNYPCSNYDETPDEPGVQEVIDNKKDAGPGSFAHYIVRFVSF